MSSYYNSFKDGRNDKKKPMKRATGTTKHKKMSEIVFGKGTGLAVKLRDKSRKAVKKKGG